MNTDIGWEGVKLKDMTREQLETAFCELNELFLRMTEAVFNASDAHHKSLVKVAEAAL